MYNDWLKFREVKEAFPIGTIVEVVDESSFYNGLHGPVMDYFMSQSVSVPHAYAYIGLGVKFTNVSNVFHYSDCVPVI